jgi:hypothetical protein
MSPESEKRRPAGGDAHLAENTSVTRATSNHDVITAAEAARLTELEDVIGRGMQTFVEVGTALAEVRDSRLYRQVAATFEEYCREQWGLSKPYATQLITAADVTVAIATERPDLPPPSREAQARELAKVEPERRAEVWTAAVESTGGKPTASAVKAAATEALGREQAEAALGALRSHLGLLETNVADAIRAGVAPTALLQEIRALRDARTGPGAMAAHDLLVDLLVSAIGGAGDVA